MTKALPIGQPRRIFRSELSKPSVKGLTVVLVAGLSVIGGVSLATLPHHAGAPTVPAAAPRELNAQPDQVAVVDAGTLRLRDQVVRLSGVEPPVRGTSCGGDQDCGAAAANTLAAMIRDAPVACRITGVDELGRPLAVCQAMGTELNSAVIAAGWGRADTMQPELQRAERTARAEHRGVWASGHDSSW